MNEKQPKNRFFQTPLSYIFLAIILLIVATASVYVTVQMSKNDPSNIPAATVDPTSVAETETLIARSRGHLAGETIVDDDAVPPVEATMIPYSEYVQKIADPANKNAGTAVVNSNYDITAVPLTTADKPSPTTYIAKYLPEQTDELLGAYAKANIPVETVTVQNSTTMYGANNIDSAAKPLNKDKGYNPTTAYMVLFALGLIAAYLTWRNMKKMNETVSEPRQKNSKNDKGALVKAGRSANGSYTVHLPDTPGSVTFADVAGADEAKEELEEVVAYLKNPDKFHAMGAKASKGILLAGPPGTGKTLLAKAVAGEAGVPFYATSGADFVEMYVGVGAKRVREIFRAAEKHPEGAIIFIDEVDAVGRARKGGENGSNQEQENTLNALLVELDGFTKRKVVLIAATNREDLLDKALTRPGRLDRKVIVPTPDRRARELILRVHAQDKPLSEEVDLTSVALRTPGMSGAELAQVVNEACLIAVRDDREIVYQMDFDHAVATVVMGKARTSAIVTEFDRTVTAWHEAGHTVSALVLPDADDPVSVTIVPRGPAGGFTWMSGNDDSFLTRRKAYAQLIVAMSGRAAEEMLMDGEFTSGPHGDLQSATQTALAMVTHYGMTHHGLMVKSDGLLSTGSNVTDSTVVAVEELLAEALTQARSILHTYSELFNAIVAELLVEDTLKQDDLQRLKDAHTGAETIVPSCIPEVVLAESADIPVTGTRKPVSSQQKPTPLPLTVERQTPTGNFAPARTQTPPQPHSNNVSYYTEDEEKTVPRILLERSSRMINKIFASKKRRQGEQVAKATE